MLSQKKGPQHPNYGKILASMGLITLPPGHNGRKPPAGAPEQDLDFQSDKDKLPNMLGCDCSDWGEWWMYAGGFQDMARAWGALRVTLGGAGRVCVCVCVLFLWVESGWSW